MTDEFVDPAEVTRALRSVRPASYRIATAPHGTTLALVMNSSTDGRRNAATRIVRLLIEHGLALDVRDPVEALTHQQDGFAVIYGKAL